MSSPTTPAPPSEGQQADSKTTIRPIPPKSAEQKRGDEIFGEDDAQSSPSADAFGVRDWRAGKGGKSRNSSQKPQAQRTVKAGSAAPSSSTPSPEEREASAAVSPSSLQPETEDPNLPAESEEIEVGGRKWSVPKAVAENFKAKNGQFKAFERRARDGVASAEGWKSHAEQLQARLDAYEKSNPNPQSSPAVSPTNQQLTPAAATSQGEPKPLVESVDWDVYEQLQQHNPRVAQQWLAEETERVMTARNARAIQDLEAKLLSRLSPSIEYQQKSAEFNKAADFFQQMSQTSDETGHWYPELHNDPDAVAEIAQIWKSIPDETFRFSPLAFHQSYLTWKDYKARQSRAQGMSRGVTAPAPPNSQSTVSPASLFPPEDNSRAQSVISGASGSPRPTAPARGRGAREQEMLDAIGSAAAIDPVFKIRRR